MLKLVIPAWSTLRTFGNHRLLKTSYVWLAIVPITAKITQEFPSQVRLSSDLTITLGLPFSWQIFFFSAVFFSAASLLYAWKCPSLIRDYSDWGEYRTKAGSVSIVRDVLHKHVVNKIPFCSEHRVTTSAPVVLLSLEIKHCSKLNLNKVATSIGFELASAEHKEFIKNEDAVTAAKATFLEPMPNKESGFFWGARSYVDYCYPLVRETTSILFAIGFALIGYLLVANIWYVTKLLF